MRMNKWNPSPGALLDWDVDEILTRTSGDMNMVRSHSRCSICGGFMATSEYAEIYNYGSDGLEPRRDCKHDFIDVESSLTDSWALMLAFKRMDYQYPDLFDEIAQRGIRTPLGAAYDENAGQTILINGHHRVAAALDLGLKTVPVRVYRNAYEVFAY